MAVDKTRYIQNPYEDYGSAESRLLIDEKKNTISDNFKTLLAMSVKQLLQRLESNEKHYGSLEDFSIYTGRTGIAYMYYSLGKSSNNQLYIRKAAELIDQSLSKWKSSKTETFVIGIAGPLALGAVIQHLHLDHETSKAMISDLRPLAKNVFDTASGLPDELLYGRVGYLYALLFVNKYVSPPPFEEHFIKQVIDAILLSGQATAKATRSESPLMYYWHDSLYVGGAHGLSGILYILLQAREYLTDSQLSKLIEPTLRYLMALRFPSGNFPSSIDNTSDKLIHWCHGAPSMPALFCLAYEIFRKPEYLEVAMQSGDVVWKRGILKKGYGICHGVAGNAYAFISLFQQTNDPKHLYRACKFAQWCTDYGKYQNRAPDRPFSLFEGLAGTIYFLNDIQEPHSAKFPAYTV